MLRMHSLQKSKSSLVQWTREDDTCNAFSEQCGWYKFYRRKFTWYKIMNKSWHLFTENSLPSINYPVPILVFINFTLTRNLCECSCMLWSGFSCHLIDTRKRYAYTKNSLAIEKHVLCIINSHILKLLVSICWPTTRQFSIQC